MNRQNANIITALGILITAWFNVLLWTGPQNPLFMLAIAFAIGATDLFDGYIARKKDIVSDLGKSLDRFRDKMFVCPFFVKEIIGLSGNTGSAENIIRCSLGVIIAIEASIVIMWVIGISRNMDVELHRAGKIKTVLYSIAVFLMLFSDFLQKNFQGIDLIAFSDWIISAILVLSAFFAFYSFLGYVKRYSL